MFAVIKTGGKQYKVKEGDTIKVEKLNLEEGKSVEFDALLVADEKGKDVKVGTPTVNGVKVKGKVLGEGKAKKIDVIKYKSKSRYRKKTGHRQPFTEVQIESIK